MTEPYWNRDPESLLRFLASGQDGLSSQEAAERLLRHGPNRLAAAPRLTRLRVVLAQCRSPLLLLLVAAALVAAATGEWADAGIVLTIVCASVGLAAMREYRAQTAVAALQARIRAMSTVLRDARRTEVPADVLVPGDIILLAAGDLVPADAVLLEGTDLHVSQSILTGESFPAVKAPGQIAEQTPLSARTNCVFMGTSVRSGMARCVVVATGAHTEFGRIAHTLRERPPDAEFERGLTRFGYLLTIAMLLLTLGVFAGHVIAGRPPVETLLFAVALAVGLSPELLPAILSVNLTRAARTMAEHGVLVRRLSAIESLGSMDTLCTDKTGTLTEGVVRVESAVDHLGAPAPRVLTLCALNAALETGVKSPLDEALLQACPQDLTHVEKRGEVPFDPVRRRVSVVAVREGAASLIVKGAVPQVLDACSQLPDGRPLDSQARKEIERLAEAFGQTGLRTLAVATGSQPVGEAASRAHETALTFEGLVTFLDRPKPGVSATLAALANAGVGVKVVTGDSVHVARHVASLVGLDASRTLTGTQLSRLTQEALWQMAPDITVFAEVDPGQKERILLALRHRGHVVGFLGDGVNDAPAMHAADVSLAVDQAVDVARSVADIVLLERDLDVIRRGITEGRRTFANTMKYLLTTTSANLGNMVSMAAASLALPFFPLLAGQILLNNFLSDVPALGIADDAVDPEQLARPERWHLRVLGRFMLTFGLLSSLFDVLTFGVLLYGFSAGPALFRTAWFVESLLTELAVALVLRTRRPFYRSRPGPLLLWSTVVLVPVAFLIPWLSGPMLGFVPLPPAIAATIVGITAAYVAATEALKRQALSW